MALQPRERRLLLLLPIVVALVLGYTYVVEPFMQRHEVVEARLGAREERLALGKRLIARRAQYEAELGVLETELQRRRVRLLRGDKAPVAASELQKLVQSTAQETGLEVRSQRILSTTEHEGYAEVPVQVTLWGPIRALVSFLYRLEGTSSMLGVTELKFRVVSVGKPRELTATVAVTGYIATESRATTRRGLTGRERAAAF